MADTTATTPSLPDVHRSVPVAGTWWRRLLAFAGPGYLVWVGYMDPATGPSTPPAAPSTATRFSPSPCSPASSPSSCRPSPPGSASPPAATSRRCAASATPAPLLGAGLASTVFAIALLASGINSTVTATLAGQIVMEGFLRLHLPPWQRRLLTRGLAVTAWFGETGTAKLLVRSQVILSMQLPFALVPLVAFVADRRLGIPRDAAEQDAEGIEPMSATSPSRHSQNTSVAKRL